MKKESLISDQYNNEYIKKMSFPQLEALSAELRQEIITTVSKTGGHLSSNLGAVELTVALHRCFDLPEDKIVWDVGHQCYSHKILTNRKEKFHTLRQEGGISGFPKTSESQFDSFVAGHAGTSIAAAFGIKHAMTLQGNKSSVVAVVGDGSFTNGMIYEGLNTLGKSGENLIVILNDNEMSISKNDGAVARYLSKIRTTPGYFKAKKATEQALLGVPFAGKVLRNTVHSSKMLVKKAVYGTTFFEELGITYYGPVDGHDIKAMCDVIMQAKNKQEPAIIHVNTKKGKGYVFAEKNPGLYHGVGAFNYKTGITSSKKDVSFSESFGKELLALAKENPKICAITAAMEHGTGLQYFSREYKNSGRYFDVGIAEEFALTLACGLAQGGMIPVFAIYSTFLQRCYDQIIHDGAIEPQHIVLAIDRAGIVGDDGETHQGIFDVALLASVPNMVVLAPANLKEQKAMLKAAIEDYNCPVAVRYPRGGEDISISQYESSGKAFDIIGEKGAKNLIVTYGRTFAEAAKAIESLTDTAILKLNKVLPIENSAIEAAMQYKNILFVEEGIKNGGIGEKFGAMLLENSFTNSYSIRAIDGFVAQSSVNVALKNLSLNAEGICKAIREKHT